MYPAYGYEAAWRRPQSYRVHAVLLVLTLLTACAAGARLADAFEHNRALTLDDLLIAFDAFRNPWMLLSGLPYAATLMTILFAHEMGHYITCMYYRIDATPPFFIPSPVIVGTFGAFIRLRSPTLSRRALFDVGVAGPIAGFIFAVPALAIGLAYSKVVPGINLQTEVGFSTPLIQRLLQWVILPGAGVNDVLLHPVARAAWWGMFATALNLLPIGQLDGGHILYAFVGDYHRPLSRVFAVSLLPLAYFSGNLSWIIWAVALLIFHRHPRIYDETKLDAPRRRLGVLALAMLVLCFMASPLRT